MRYKPSDAETDSIQELQWIQKAQRGDPNALSQLISVHRACIHALAARLSVDREFRKDLIQAGYIGLLQAIRRYMPEHEVRLITYAVPWILGEMKKVLRSCLDVRMHECGSIEYHMNADTNPATGTEFRIECIDLHRALENLSADEQLLICLRYFRGKTQRESAVILKKSQAQISRLESNALNKLQQRLR